MPCVTCATRDQINNKLENMEYPLGVSVPVPVLISASTCLELEKLNLFLSLTFAIVPQRFTMKYFFSIFRFFFCCRSHFFFLDIPFGLFHSGTTE